MKIYLPIQKEHLGCDHLMFPKCCAFPLDNGHQFKQVITQGNVTTHIESRSDRSCNQEIFRKSWTVSSTWLTTIQIYSIMISAKGFGSEDIAFL